MLHYLLHFLELLCFPIFPNVAGWWSFLTVDGTFESSAQTVNGCLLSSAIVLNERLLPVFFLVDTMVLCLDTMVFHILLLVSIWRLHIQFNHFKNLRISTAISLTIFTHLFFLEAFFEDRMLLSTILGNELKFAGASLSCAGREFTTSKMDIMLGDSISTSASSSCSSSYPWLLSFSSTQSSIALLSAKLQMHPWDDMLHFPTSALKIFLAYRTKGGYVGLPVGIFFFTNMLNFFWRLVISQRGLKWVEVNSVSKYIQSLESPQASIAP